MRLVMSPAWATTMTCGSAVFWPTYEYATEPPPPTLLTTTDSSILFSVQIFCITRAVLSLPPPAAENTTISTARSGFHCACAVDRAASRAAHTKQSRERDMRYPRFFLIGAGIRKQKKTEDI